MATLRFRMNWTAALAAGLVVFGAWGILRERGGSRASAAPACDPTETSCEDTSPEPQRGTLAAPVLDAATACSNVGYLCADLGVRERIHLRRWKNFSGTLVVHVPRPDFEGAGVGIELQRAASLGIRAWHNQPFPILIDMMGDRDPHLTVEWSTLLGSMTIGQARTRWSPSEGLTPVSLELTTRSPYRQNEIAGALQVRLAAAHEMGHILGLSHSDSERDVMFPTNTATAVSAQDRRTMETLYSHVDGTEITR